MTSLTPERLEIYLNGRVVGALRRLPNAGIEFSYAETWLRWERTFPISLSLPLRRQKFSGDRVLAVFDNLLPDTQALKDKIAAETHADGTDAYSLLSKIGRDCVGALQFLPEGESPGATGEVVGEPLDQSAMTKLIGELDRTPLGLDPEGRFRISLAGAQAKTALLRKEKQWFRPLGATATTHILKPSIGRQGWVDLEHSVGNEHFCLQFLTYLDVTTAKSEILAFQDLLVLSVERFDRLWTTDGRLLRLPQEDFCQALSIPPSKKYEANGGPGLVDLLKALRASDEPERDQTQLLTAVVCFWLLGAPDGHAKNFSINHMPGGGFHLSPIYDVLSVQHLLAERRIRHAEVPMAMSVGTEKVDQINRILPRHFVESAREAGIGESIVQRIFGSLASNLPSAINRAERELGATLPKTERAAILDGVRDRFALFSRN